MIINSDEDASTAWALEDEGSGSRRVARRRTTSERPAGGESVSQKRGVLRKRRRLAEHRNHGRTGRTSTG